jgi:hypothetical protein
MIQREMELLDQLSQEILELCPDAIIKEVVRSPEGTLIMRVQVPDDETDEWLSSKMAERSTDILLEEGLSIGVATHYLETPESVAA